MIYPPVDVERFALRTVKEDFYVAASRMVPYKRMPLIAEAFAAMPGKQLVVIGAGADLERVKSIARSAPNIRVLGCAPEAVLVDHLSRAKVYVFAAEEDFGISPVEAQACGTPVIAYGAGGVRDTIIASGPAEGRTGIFFAQQTTELIRSAVEAFEASGPFDPSTCRRNAERFSAGRFREDILTAVHAAVTSIRGESR